MTKQTIQDIEIIDLDDTDLDSIYPLSRKKTDKDASDAIPENDAPEADAAIPTHDAEEDGAEGKKPFRIRLNMHIVLLAVTVLTFAFILYRYLNWGHLVEFGGKDENYLPQSYDSMIPLMDENENIILPDLKDGLSIAIFGNGAFAGNNDSKDGLAAMLADATGASIYNCSIEKSHLSSSLAVPDMAVNPWDAFSFYRMTLFAANLLEPYYFDQAVEALGADAPAEAANVRRSLTSLASARPDYIVIMYDASDYFAGRPASHPSELIGAQSGVQTFAGNLYAGLEILQQYFPGTRIIVMSPSYAFSDRLDESGKYISSDIVRYGQDSLSVYVSKAAEACTARHVTFVDNFYVTFNEDNAQNYLSDNRLLNAAGRKKAVERLVYAINYFNTGTASSTPVSR